MALVSVKLLFKILYHDGQLLSNPACDIAKLCGLRYRAMFELVYSSALRISEVANLDIIDIDFEEWMLLVRQGKFSKDRMVPVSIAACRY